MKGKVWKRLTAAATAALSALSLALGSGANLTAHAELAKEHYTKSRLDWYAWDNEDVMGSFGTNEKISSYAFDGITFKSDYCKTNRQLKDKNRNFVIEKDKTFTISISEGKNIRAIEFGDDISGTCSCTTSSYKRTTGDDYVLFENYDATKSSLTFKADSEDGFSFEDIIVYIVFDEYSDFMGNKTTKINKPTTVTLLIQAL